jgi:hypothetical protein
MYVYSIRRIFYFLEINALEECRILDVAVVRTDVSEKNRLHHKGYRNWRARMVLGTVMMETIRSSGTSVNTRAARYNIMEDGILHRRRRGNPKFYI